MAKIHMNFTIIGIACLAMLLGLASAQKKCPKYDVKFFVDSGRKARDIRDTVNRYRRALGGRDNGNEPGPIAKGQRSINWDAAAVPFDMPFNFFDKNVPRGIVFKAKGNKFAVSNPVGERKDDRFDSLIGKKQAREFRRFSLKRLFTSVRGNVIDIRFKVPAKKRRAAVTGFGAVFTDVDRKRFTSMTYFDHNGCRIAKIIVPPEDKGLSFAGVIVRRKGKKVPVVAKVVVKLGTVSIAEFRKGKRGDLVTMDDLFFGEPQEKK